MQQQKKQHKKLVTLDAHSRVHSQKPVDKTLLHDPFLLNATLTQALEVMHATWKLQPDNAALQ
jgi:hypothetical protein